jgi:ABC-type multidrug transport system ATPase subunit
MSSQSPALPALVVRQLCKGFGAINALANVSFSVFPQQILGLIGANGAGKTTLLECVCGLLPTDGGDVLWHGKELPQKNRRAAMFYLPDGIMPYPKLTVRRVLDFVREVYDSDRDTAKHLVESLGLSPVLDRQTDWLSKGWRRRFLLGIGLLTPHPVLLIDEPFDGLDLRQTLEMMTVFREARSQGRTFVLSIHQLSEAQRICDRFVLLTEGRVAGEGTLAELNVLARAESKSLEDVFLALS